MPHRCEDPICWRDDGTHAEGCVFWIHSAMFSNFIRVRYRGQFGETARVVLNAPTNVVDWKGRDVWRNPPEGPPKE